MQQQTIWKNLEGAGINARYFYQLGLINRDTYQSVVTKLSKIHTKISDNNDKDIDTAFGLLKDVTLIVGTSTCDNFLALHVDEEPYNTLPDDWKWINNLFIPSSATFTSCIIKSPKCKEYPFPKTIEQTLNGVIVEYGKIRIRGYLKNTDFVEQYPHILKSLERMNQIVIPSVPDVFIAEYIEIMSLRDLLIGNVFNTKNKIKRAYDKIEKLSTGHMIQIMLEQNVSKLVELCTLLAIYDDNKELSELNGIILKSFGTEVFPHLHYKIQARVIHMLQDNPDEEEQAEAPQIPYETRIKMMKDAPIEARQKGIQMLKTMSEDSKDGKVQTYIDGLLKIPFGAYSESPLMQMKMGFQKQFDTFIEDIKQDYHNIPQTVHGMFPYFRKNKLKDEYQKNYKKLKSIRLKLKNCQTKVLHNCRASLDNAAYGHVEAKTQLERLMAQWLNGEDRGMILGIQGPPGNGKTTLIKNGLSNSLCDGDGNPRPCAFMPLGGSSDGATLVGHNYTYTGSCWGRILDILMQTKCMNPIIIVDELDKVSKTENGREITGILTHLTDTTQNMEFSDKYFSGIPIDMSRAIFVFTFNDPSMIDPILLDRITVVQTKPLTLDEKVRVIQDYVFPDICKAVGFLPGEVSFEDEDIMYLAEAYTIEPGVRKLKELVIDLVREANLRHIKTKDTPCLNRSFFDDVFKLRCKMKPITVPENAKIGYIHGLYATSLGNGGVLPIEIKKMFSKEMLSLKLTGMQGDVMKESMNCALTIAWNLLSSEEQQQIENDAPFGLHIHCPEAATPKDGPSAGLAITLCILSVLKQQSIHPTVCMTGEIDLNGNVRAIGGLGSKLRGAKYSKMKKCLVPDENIEDLRILRDQNASQEDDDFELVVVKHISEALPHIF